MTVQDLAAHVAVGHGHHPGQGPHQPAGLVLPLLVGPGLGHPLACLGQGRPQQPGAEEVEHEGEVLHQGRPGQDKEQAQHQGDNDARQEHLLLVPAGHPEGGHHNDEHEEVVHAQGLLGEVAREVRAPVGVAPDRPHHAPEDHRHGHVGHRPPGGLPHGGHVGDPDVADDVDRDHGQDDGGQGRPPQGVDVHVCSSGTGRVPEVSSRPAHTGPGPRRRGSPDRGTVPARSTVVTTPLLVGVLPSEC